MTMNNALKSSVTKLISVTKPGYDLITRITRGLLYISRCCTTTTCTNASKEAPLKRGIEGSDSNRGFHSTSAKRMGGHGHDAHDDYEYYLHAKHMYNLDRMKYQRLKVTLGVMTAFSIGVGVPIYAVIFQQRKTASG